MILKEDLRILNRNDSALHEHGAEIPMWPTF